MREPRVAKVQTWIPLFSLLFTILLLMTTSGEARGTAPVPSPVDPNTSAHLRGYYEELITDTMSFEEAVSILDSVQTDVVVRWWQRGFVVTEDDDSLQSGVARSLFRATGDSLFLEVAGAGRKRLAAMDLTLWLGPSEDQIKRIQIESLLDAREIYAARELWKQMIITNLLASIFSLYCASPDFPRALTLSFEGLEMARQHSLIHWEAHAYSTISRLFRQLKMNEIAREYAIKAHEIARSTGDNIALLESLLQLGKAEYNLGDVEGALERFIELDHVSKNVLKGKHPPFPDYIGKIKWAMGDTTAALHHFSEMVDFMKERGFNVPYCGFIFNLGWLHEQCGDTTLARRQYERVVSLTSTSNIPVRWKAIYQLGTLAECEGKTSEAAENYMDAISCIEQVRTNIGTGEIQTSFLEDRMLPYDRLISLLYRMSRDDPNQHELETVAFEYCERSRMRGFIESRAVPQPLADILDPDLLHRHEEILYELNKLRKDLFHRTSSKSREEILSEIEELKLALMETKIAIDLSVKGPAHEYQYADLLILGEAQEKILEPGVCIIEYYVGKESTYAWLLKHDSIRMTELPHIMQGYHPVQVYNELISREEASETIGKRLFQDLLAPFYGDFHDIQTIIIIPDNILHYLSFESLPIERGCPPSGAGTLIEQFDIAYAPSLSTLIYLIDRSEEMPGYENSVFAIGDPVDEEGPGLIERIKNLFEEHEAEEEFHFPFRTGNIPRLKNSGDEVRTIAALFPAGRSKTLTKRDAHEGAIKEEDLQPFSVIHFATHGIYDDYTPELSGLLLSPAEGGEDGFLTADEIRRLDLNASMVVLSGCKTGLGEYVRGEGVVGLSRAFLEAGAVSAVVSLWAVEDKQTERFMETFYRLYMSGLAKSEALSHAKRDMIRRGTSPSHWAPFILIGDFH